MKALKENRKETKITKENQSSPTPQGPVKGSLGFTTTHVNRDSLEPLPVDPQQEICHRNVCGGDLAADYSKSRGHPVFPIKLPSNTVSFSIGDLEPGQKTSNHRHAYESLIYVIEGEGYSIIEGKKIPWKKDDAVYVPPWNWHQHFSTSSKVRYLTGTNLPLLYSMGQTVLREEEKTEGVKGVENGKVLNFGDPKGSKKKK